jgi:hypothetical protein
MNHRSRRYIKLVSFIILATMLLCGCGSAEEDLAPAADTPAAVASPEVVAEGATAAIPEPAAEGPNPNPPSQTVKLIFIHHSCGENWLADDDGGLGIALRDNNYFVSDTNYGWGPEGIGDRTDITDWTDWFRGPNSSTYLDALYTEYGDNSYRYTRGTDPDPNRENQVILFKSCFPNSNLEGNPGDPPAPGEGMTVGGAKAIYADLLNYFATRPDKLFVAITAPPVAEGESETPPANARAFNNWLVNDWLAGYALNNVAIFDFYNVLTSNGGNADTNDLGQEGGNHHRWWDGAVQHIQAVNSDLAAYPSDDSHPSSAGNRKATAEFVPLLNIFYHRWQGEPAVAAAPTVAEVPPTEPVPRATAPAVETAAPLGLESLAFQDGSSPDPTYSQTEAVILTNDLEPNVNLGAAEHIEVFFGEEEYRRSLLRWELSALPMAITIDNAQLELYRYEGGAESPMQIAVFRVTSPWSEGSSAEFYPEAAFVPDGATWSEASPGVAWSTPGGDFDTTSDHGHGPTGILDQVLLPVDESTGWIVFDVTAAVRAWVEGGVPNCGLLLRPLDGEYTYHYFYSDDAPDPTLRPRLVVNYHSGEETTELPPPTAVPPGTAAPTTPRGPLPTELIHPEDLVYVGAFRLPDDADGPRTFEYGGNAMTFNPDGDPTNTDPYPGSLFVMGHDRMAYGDMPDGNQVAEVSIPVPAIASNPADLPQAVFIQGFHDVTAGYFTELEEIPKVGMQYLNHPATGPKIHLVWGQHLQPPDVPSHAWFNPTLATPDLQGVWFVGDLDLYSTTRYLFEIPASWADTYVQGRYLATGRMRDGGQGGMGPVLVAYRPWLPDGSAPPSGTHLEETTLLLYENAYNTADLVRCLEGYQYPDEWEGGAWITTPSGKSAVLFAGTKGTGTKMWYGYINPRGPEYPCVDANVTDFDTCRMADGSSCPAEDYAGCCDEERETCVTGRGWWTTRFDAQFILYNPADLAQVASGTMESWEPQPYASLDIDEHLYLDPPEWDLITVGWGDQRRNRIGPTAYDRDSNLLYVVEQYGEEAKPVVHVWSISD